MNADKCKQHGHCDIQKKKKKRKKKVSIDSDNTKIHKLVYKHHVPPAIVKKTASSL